MSKIWVMDRFSPCWEDDSLVSALQEMGTEARYVDWNSVQIDGDGIRIGGEPAHPPDLAYVRSRIVTQPVEGWLAQVYDSLAMLDDIGVLMVNQLNATRRSKNKVRQARLLGAAGVRVPPTRMVATTRDIERCLAEWGTIVLKPVYGHASIDVMLLRPPRRGVGGSGLETQEEVHAWHLLGTHRTLCAQKFVPNSGRDLRVAIIGRQIVACYWKEISASSGSLPVREYRMFPSRITDDIAWICATATEALGLEIAILDLVEGEDGMIVIEANTGISGWEHLEQVPGIDLTESGLTDAHARYLVGVAERRRPELAGAEIIGGPTVDRRPT